MSEPKLIRMANNIAGFFQSYPRDEAVRGIHDHIRAFWTPKMRTALGVCAGSSGTELHPLVRAALTLTPTAKNPTDKEAAGPAEVGEIGASDAG